MVDEALGVFLNPDCGFGTFATRAMNSPEIASQKLAAIAEAAARLRRSQPSSRATCTVAVPVFKDLHNSPRG